jgi:hypothetical protein
MISNFSQRMSFLAVSAALAAALFPAAAHAVLVHRYTFSGNANDSVGTAHGTVVDAGAPTHAYLNGQLVLSGNTGQGSNGISEDAFVDLPNGIVSAAASGGTSGAISFEFWATVATQRTWQRFGDFGTADGADPMNPNDGENMSNGGGASDYMLITPNSGRFNNGLEMTNHDSTGPEPNAGIQGPYGIGAERHVVAVYDKNDTNGGANAGGTMRLYLQGTQVATGAISAVFDPNTLIDNNNWLGRSQWNDPVFDGLYNEVSIYNHAVTAAEVATNFTTGPVGGSPGLPVVTINRDTGGLTLATSSGTLRVLGVTINSPAGGGQLIPENWAPISGRLDAPINGGNGSFDADDIWQAGLVMPPAPNVLEEAMTFDGVGDDGGLLTTTPITLNTAGNRLWRQFFNENVNVILQAQVPGGQVVDLPAAVSFTGNGGVAWRRSDLNFDNSINAADYTIFLSNHRKPIDPLLTDAQSYVFGDISGDQDNDFGDFRLFQADYTAANGAAAFAALLASVPEPSSAALAALAVLGGVMRRRRSC